MAAKILYIDIETKPIEAFVWGLFDQNIGLEMIKDDWRIISVAAKWEDETEVMQWDTRAGINSKNEKALLEKVWKLLDAADIVIGQNSISFDIKKLNEKFLQHKMSPPSPYRQMDTLRMSKKTFAPTSHKLEYRSKSLNKKYTKMSHSKYPGFSLWKACMAGDKKAWTEMALYNKFDVLATQEYFNILKPWGTNINLNVFSDDLENKCNACGSSHLNKRGYETTNSGRFQKYQCKNCGKWAQGKINLLSKDKKAALRK